MTPQHGVLIITGGITPQVVTETLWALSQRNDFPWPGQVIYVTTARGGDLGEALQGPEGRIAELCAELNRPPPDFEVRIPKIGGAPIKDLRSEDEVIAFGDLMAHLVGELTRHEDFRVHVSMAGGRKSMSHHAAQALSLFGRPQDELSHVLVHPEAFEFNPEFWWPYAPPRQIPASPRASADGESVSTTEARVELIPDIFARHNRAYPPEGLTAEDSLYRRELVRAEIELTRPPVVLDIAQRTISVGPDSFRFGGQYGKIGFALYRFFSEARRDELTDPALKDEDESLSGWWGPDGLNASQYDRIDDYYQDTYVSSNSHPEDKFPLEFAAKNLSEMVSSMKRFLVQCFGVRIADLYRVQGRKVGGVTYYGLTLRPDRIIIENV